MKNLTYLILLLPSLLFSQINMDNNWANEINLIFQNLDKSKITSGMLLDYAMEFTNVEAYNGTLTDSTYVNANVVGDVYKTLFMSKVVADTTHTPLFDRYAYNWARARFNATQDSSGVYILTGLLYEYQKLNQNALSQNKISVINNKYYDRYINGTWQNPYETHKTFALTPPILNSRSKDVIFKLPNELFLTNLGSQIANIQLDADNGQGYQNLPFDTAVPFQFYQNKLHDLTFKINLSNGQTLYCRSKFKIDDPNLNPEFIEFPYSTAKSTENQNKIYIYEGNNIFSGAWITIRRTPNNETNNRITRPLIIAEGLDTGKFTAPEDFGGETTLQNFINDVNASQSNDLENLLIRNNTQSYDLIYIDWERGMADLRDNSGVLEEVIKWVNANKTTTAESNVLLGQSMGGVIGRYTLARMENTQATNPSAPDHDVRLFIAHDSPMQGLIYRLACLTFLPI